MRKQCKKCQFCKWLILVLFCVAVLSAVFYYINQLNMLAKEYSDFFTAFTGIVTACGTVGAVIASCYLNKKQKELQIDLQTRQIKLDSYNIKIGYLKRITDFSKLVVRIVTIDNDEIGKNIAELDKQYKQHKDIFDKPINFYELLLIIDCNDEIKKQIELIQTCYEGFYNSIKRLCENNHVMFVNDMLISNNDNEKLQLYNILKKNLTELVKLLPNIIDILTKGTDISKIDKIRAI